MKKNVSITLAIMMLVSIAFIIAPSVSASNTPRNVDGYVIVDGTVTEPQKIVLSFPGQDIEATTYSDGFYILAFEEEDDQTGSFFVTLSEGTWEASEDITIENGILDYEINLTIDTSEPQDNSCPDQPTSPSPSTGANNQQTTVTLSVDADDADGDSLTVTFFDASDDSEIGSDTIGSPGTASVTWSSLSYDTTYSWYAISNDGTCDSSQSETWSFTTEEEDTGGGNNGGGDTNGGNDNTGGGGGIPAGGGYIPPANEPPVADAGGPYFGTPGEEIEFDGSDSNDSDGEIVSYSWDFGDGNAGSTQTPTHSFSSPGEYTVTLTVEDDDRDTDTDSTTVNIVEPTYPPEDPTISGPSEGEINISYNFTVVSTDKDNDTIQYTIEWGDGEDITTDFLSNGTTKKLSHAWSSAGDYTITVKAYDNDTYSGTISHTITINEPKKEDSTSTPEQVDDQDNTIFYIAGILIVIVLLIIFYLVTRKKE